MSNDDVLTKEERELVERVRPYGSFAVPELLAIIDRLVQQQPPPSPDVARLIEEGESLYKYLRSCKYNSSAVVARDLIAALRRADAENQKQPPPSPDVAKLIEEADQMRKAMYPSASPIHVSALDIASIIERLTNALENADAENQKRLAALVRVRDEAKQDDPDMWREIDEAIAGVSHAR